MNSNSVQLVPSRAVNTDLSYGTAQCAQGRYGTAQCPQGRYGTGTAQCAQGRLVSSRGSRLQKRAALTAHISSS